MALRKSEASLAAAQLRAKIGNWELTLADKKGSWSAEMYRLFGWNPARGVLSFDEFMKLIHPEDRAVFGQQFAQAITERSDLHQDFRIIWPDGSIHWIEGRAEIIHDEMGRPVRMIGTSQDVTERKQAEAALRESEERFRQIAENIHEVFWLIDPANQAILYLSPAFEKIYGLSRESAYRDPAVRLAPIHQDDRRWATQALAAQLASGQYDETYRIVRPDATVRWVRDRAYPILGPTGALSRIVGTTEDITEQQQLEAQFRQAQKMEAVGTLAGGIAHDFNNILAAVKGYAQLAKADAADRPDLQEHLDAVLQGTHRAADLVRQIITFSRQHDTQHSPVRLQTVAAEALTLLRATIPTTVEIKTVVESGAPAILADPTQIHQVVMNLCTNAWHAMKSHPGRLELRVEALTIDREFAQTHPELRPGPHVRLTVADTGCGMDQATLGRIFEPFFTTKAPGEGSGLGLAVVHGIMRSHHGAIIVHSEPMQGTTFHLYFPEFIGAVAAEIVAPTERAPAGHGERVLLVDDEVSLLHMGTIILERAGYTVQTFSSGALALAELRLKPAAFDLVVSDLAMPGLSGIELAAELRLLRPDLPIILTSGYIDGTTKETIKSLSLQRVLLKPYTVESLSLAVHQVLSSAPGA